MSALSVQPTYPIFTDIDGQPLEAGYVWIGTANLDPQTNPITVYWDAALTILAPQPIRTLAGYPSNNGTPGRLYVDSDYSIRVMNKNGSTVYNAPAATERYGNVINADGVVYDPPFTNAVQTNVEAKLAQTISVKDFGAVGDGVTDDSVAVQNAVNSIPVDGGIVSFKGITNIAINAQILVKKHTLIDLHGCTVKTTLDDVLFYFNKQGLNSGLPSFHGGDGGNNYWCDGTTGVIDGRVYGPTTSPYNGNLYVAASDRIIGFMMHNVHVSYGNALQLNGESWLADIQSVQVYNVTGTAFKHQLNPWGNWEETPGVPISSGNGPNNASYINCWAENRVGGGLTGIGWDIASGSANIYGSYIEALDVCIKGSAVQLSNSYIGSRSYAGKVFQIDRSAYFNVSGCNISIANTLEVDVFDVLQPSRIVFSDNTLNLSFSGNNCSFLQTIAETEVNISGNRFRCTFTNVNFWDFFHILNNGTTQLGSVVDSTISGNTIEAASTKWVYLVSTGSTGKIQRSSVVGNTFRNVDRLVNIEQSVVNSNNIDGGNSTAAFFANLSVSSVFSDNSLTNNSPNVTLDSTCRATGNLGYQGTVRRGTFTGNGDGTNRIFTITHGLPTGMTPAHVSIAPRNFATSSAGNWYYQNGVGTTEIIFNVAPGAGTGNVVFTWEIQG